MMLKILMMLTGVPAKL